MVNIFAEAVIVIGGGGYLSYHVALELSRRGRHVVVFDLLRPNPQLADAFARRNDDADAAERIEFFQGSICNLDDLK